MEKTRVFQLLTATFFVCLFLPALVQDGMFLDGVTYSAIANNMANGYGSFWDPHYTKTLYAHFHEHPPLVFIVQSWFFKVFGHAFYTERIYSLFIALLTVTGLLQCWRLLTTHTILTSFSWLPVLLWLLVPLVSWSYKNNLLENTLGVFTIFSVFFILKALIERKIGYLFLGSMLVVSAFLSKGVVGLFPLVVPILYVLIYRPNHRVVLYAVYLFLFTGFLSYCLLTGLPELTNNIVAYLNQQLLPALNNQREITTNNRFSIMLKLLVELAVPVVILVYLMVKYGPQNNKFDFLKDKNALFLFGIGFCASFPLIISLKQRSFYLIPAIPFFVLSISFLIVPVLKNNFNKLSDLAVTRIKYGSFLALLTVLVFSVVRFGSFSRDKEKLSDVYTISGVLPQGTIIGTSEPLCSDWGLVAYMSRIGYLSLDCSNSHEYLLIGKHQPNLTTIPEGYEGMDLKLSEYILVKRK